MKNFRFDHFFNRYSGILALFATLLTLSGAYYSAQLYINLRTNFEELLPVKARSVQDLNEVTSRLESVDNLAVLVFSKNTQASKKFVQDLSALLSKVPKDTIASVEFQIKNELQFFSKRRPLYMDLKDLQDIDHYIDQKIDYETQLYNPLTIFSEENIPEPSYDFIALKNKYDSQVSQYSRFPDGYYATPDETKRVILVNKPGKASDVDILVRIKNEVEKAIHELNPTVRYAPDIEIHYSGGVQNTLDEQSALVADLELSTIIVMVLVSLALLFFFREWKSTLALLIALFSGTFITFGISFFAVGYLNANSAFLGSIVLGNGINFGIIYLARYLEERRNGHPHSEALQIAQTQTFTSTLTAALAAGLSYGSLMLTSFRGFSQFGVIGLIGMICCWLSFYTFLPALLTLLDRWKLLNIAAVKHQHESTLSHRLALFIQNHSKAITAFSLILSIVSIIACFKVSPKIIETDLSKLKSKASQESGSGYYSQYVDEIFKRYLTPMVILPRKIENVDTIATLLRKQKAADGPKSLIANVQTLQDFIPKNQSEKIKTIQSIEQRLNPQLLKRIGNSISPEQMSMIQTFITPESKIEIHATDLPGLILSKFTEKDGSLGKLVLIEPPLTNETGNGDLLFKFIHDLRSVADSVEPGAPLAGSLPISADLLESILLDGPKATAFAFFSVVILLILLFRKPKVILPATLALILGILWLAGFIFAFWFKINFLNFIALPISFGIGVDYGVNIFQRYREEGAHSMFKVIQDTGSAVALCSFTTMVGYGSLLIAQNRAFVSFGLLAVIGELTCLIAALFTLPAALLWMHKIHQTRLRKTT